MDKIRDILRCQDASVNGRGVRIAVLDTGVDLEHPDLANRIDEGASCCACLTDSLRDRDGHGTHVAGIIAGTGSASGGRYRGIAPGAELIIIKVTEGAEGLSDEVMAGVTKAVERGAQIINYSGGTAMADKVAGPPPWKWSTKLSKLDEAFQYAARQGILCVAAAGNDGPAPGSVIRPASLPEILCVGATTHEGRIAPASARGPVYLDAALRKNVVRALGERP